MSRLISEGGAVAPNTPWEWRCSSSTGPWKRESFPVTSGFKSFVCGYKALTKAVWSPFPLDQKKKKKKKKMEGRGRGGEMDVGNKETQQPGNLRDVSGSDGGAAVGDISGTPTPPFQDLKKSWHSQQSAVSTCILCWSPEEFLLGMRLIALVIYYHLDALRNSHPWTLPFSGITGCSAPMIYRYLRTVITTNNHCISHFWFF